MWFRTRYERGTAYFNGIEISVKDFRMDVPNHLANNALSRGYIPENEMDLSVVDSSLVKFVDKAKKRIDLAICLPHTLGGGSETRMIQTAKNLKEYNVYIFYIKDYAGSGSLKAEFEKLPNVVGMFYTPKEKSIRQHCIRYDIDIMLFYGTDMPVRAFANRIRPVMILSVNVDTYQHGIEFVDKCKNNVDAIVTVSSHIADKIRKKHKLIVPIVSGADDERFYPSEERSKDGIVRIGYIGRLIAHKGVELIAEALFGLQNVEFLVAGSKETYGVDYERLKEKCEALNIDWKYFGYVMDPENIFRKIDILVTMSTKEGFPMMVIEGALSKCAIIATKCGGLDRVFTHDKNIIFVKRKVSALRNQLIELIIDVKRREALAQSAYELAKKNMTIQKVIDNYRKLFDLLITKSRKQKMQIGLYRCGGGGDIIMSEPAVRRLKEIYPNANFIYECSNEFKCVAQALGFKVGLIGAVRRKIKFKYDIPLNGKPIVHSIKQYFDQIGVKYDGEIPQMAIECVKRNEREVAFQTTSHCKEKNWSRKNWEKLVELIKNNNLIPVQIDEGDTITGAVHLKSSSLEKYLSVVPQFHLIVSVDTITPHICAATNTPCIVLWGKSSSPDMCGYKQHRNIVAPFDCRCWVSVNQKDYKNPNCPGQCVDSIKPKVVMKIILEERKKWRK